MAQIVGFSERFVHDYKFEVKYKSGKIISVDQSQLIINLKRSTNDFYDRDVIYIDTHDKSYREAYFDDLTTKLKEKVNVTYFMQNPKDVNEIEMESDLLVKVDFFPLYGIINYLFITIIY